MKFNFQKLSAVATSIAMIGASVGFAAAAPYPAPFVVNGVGNFAVVYGANAPVAGGDAVTAATVGNNIQSRVTGTGGGVPEGGDFYKVELGSDLFNLGENISAFRSTIDESELTHILAEGTYSNDDGDESEYKQSLTFGNNLVLTFFEDNEFNEDDPTFGFDLASNTHIFNYTLDFTDDVNADDSDVSGYDLNLLEGTDLPFLGRSYYISNAESSNYELTLLDSADTKLLELGQTDTIGGYEVQLKSVGEPDSDGDSDVQLFVNGQIVDIKEGQSKRITGTTAYIAIEEAFFSSREADTPNAQVSVGAGKLVLQSGSEVELNDDDLDGVTAFITNSSDNLQKIVLQWIIDDDDWIAQGTDLLLPGFESIKFSFGGMNFPAEEVTRIDNSGDNLRLSTVIEEGAINLDLLFTDDTSAFKGIGEDATSRLITSTGTTVSVDNDIDDWIVISWKSGTDAETFILEVNNVDSDDDGTNETELVSTPGDETLDFDIGPGQSSVQDTIGNLILTVSNLNAANENFTLAVTASSGTASMDRLFTKEGMQILLPVNSTAAVGEGTGLINLSASPNAFRLNFTEADEDHNIASGAKFSTNLSITSDFDPQPSTFSGVTLQDTEDDDVEVGYVVSELATKVMHDDGGDTSTADSAEITYHGEEVSADVFVSEALVTITPQGGSPIFRDSEVSSVANRNLIVIGGSCINTAAARLLNVAEGTCGADFTAATGVGTGEFWIGSSANPWATSAGRIALLVAGYEGPDTTAAGNYLINRGSSVDTAEGKSYKGTTATNTVVMQEA